MGTGRRITAAVKISILSIDAPTLVPENSRPLSGWIFIYIEAVNPRIGKFNVFWPAGQWPWAVGQRIVAVFRESPVGPAEL